MACPCTDAEVIVTENGPRFRETPGDEGECTCDGRLDAAKKKLDEETRALGIAGAPAGSLTRDSRIVGDASAGLRRS